MDLQTLLLVIGTIAIILTLIVGLIFKGHKSWLMTFLQNFCGVFFIFSGFVKAIDPVGTGYKMEQYFGEFESTFADTWFSFVAPIFPFLSKYAIGFSVGMIVFEIVLGIMLIMGAKSKFTSWAFLILVAFFTVLTGFTYLTGYVPPDSNFFAFGSWGPYLESNMKVTDCGCFGDFIKLKPKTTFLKDVCLMFPALFFVWKHKDMHQLFGKGIRTGIIALSTVGLFIFCLSNFVWNLPSHDFRPFAIGNNVKEMKANEMKSMADVQIQGWIFENTNTGEIVPVNNPDYMVAAKPYPKDKGWKVKDQMLSEPLIAPTKASEFEVTTMQSDDVTEEILNDPNISFMIVSYKAKSDGQKEATRMVRDTTYTIDTILVEGSTEPMIVKTIGENIERSQKYTDITWDSGFAEDYMKLIQPFAAAAQKNNKKVYAVIGGLDEAGASDLISDLGLTFDIYTADEILLKTIIRSNPGVVMWKNGQIVDKWHKSKLPDFEDVRAKYFK